LFPLRTRVPQHGMLTAHLLLIPLVPLPVVVEKIQRPSSAAGGDSSSGSSHQFLVILSKQQAMDIYTMRSPDTTVDPDLKVVAGKSSMVAEMYGVSPKTVRVCSQAPYLDDNAARLIYIIYMYITSLSLSLSLFVGPRGCCFHAA